MPWRRLCLKEGHFRPRAVVNSSHKPWSRYCTSNCTPANPPAVRYLNSQAYDGTKIARSTSLNDGQVNQNETITIAGLVRSIRKQKKVAFAHISDGFSLEPVQAILDPSQAKDITNGSYVELSGNWKPSPGKGQTNELHVSAVKSIGDTDLEDYPIQKKSQPADFLRGLPHLRMRTPLYSLVARTRSQLISGIHDFYSKTRPAGPAIQVHPPLITSSDCEGAGEVFTISPRNAKPLVKDQNANSQLYFKGNKYLTVSAQLHLEAYAAELGDVWTLSPTFRAEESETPRHLSEFYMLEAEFRSITSLKGLMAEVQQLLQHLVRDLTSSSVGRELLIYHSDPKYVNSDNERGPDHQDRWQRILEPEWPEITYRDAISLLESHGNANPNAFVHPVSFATGLQLEHERFLVNEFANGFPLFVTNYPQHIKPFYMLPSDAADEADFSGTDKTVACFDLLFPFGSAEVVGGSLREHRLPNLIQTMREKGLVKRAQSNLPHAVDVNTSSSLDATVARYPFLDHGETLGSLEWYADLRRYGTSPHGGFGMGFDRILAYVSGISNVRDTVGFPRYFGRADC